MLAFCLAMQKRGKRITRAMLVASGDISVHPVIATLKELQKAGHAKLTWYRVKSRNHGQQWVFDEKKRWRYINANVSKSGTLDSGVTDSVTLKKCNASPSQQPDLWAVTETQK